MEYLESSRSARKMDPERTVRFRRADPRGSSIIFGFEQPSYETTNGRIQRQVASGSIEQGRLVRGERSVSLRRKRGMLDSTLFLGNARNNWKSEAKQQFHKFDLKNWGPRSIKQQDSYSWTSEDRKQLATLRDAKGLPPIVESPHYNKLPPIKTHHVNQNGALSESSTADGAKVQNRTHSRSYKSHRLGSINNNYN